MCSEIFLSGIGNSRRDGGAANPVRTEHGDITAAASAIFASANANSWPIGKHHAYGMGSISWWRKGDNMGTGNMQYCHHNRETGWKIATSWTDTTIDVRMESSGMI